MNPIDEHKFLIESMVKLRGSIGAKLLRTEGIVTRASRLSQFNDLASKLDEGGRELLAQILEKERSSAIHDVLVRLHDGCELEGLSLSKNGQIIPHEPFGYTMCQEYVALCEGDDWSTMED